jgi:hypothetical protein
MSIPESIPEDRQESYECECGGGRVQVGDHWECDKCDWVSTPPPVQSDQSDEDPHEKDAIRCGERLYERNAVLPDDDVIL